MRLWRLTYWVSGLVAALTAAGAADVLTAQDAPSGPTFAEFLAGVRTDAERMGISAATLDAALTDLTPLPVVVARDRAQPEQTLSLDAYLARRVTPRMIALARQRAQPHQAVLKRVEDAYGVPASVVIAIWGLESNFGRFTGTYSTVRALATLAYDGRRPLFRTELLQALQILDRGDVPANRLKGSWAGAMGQPQFMPSSFAGRAVDFDGDGRRDIWTSAADVFGSIANYLREEGWLAGRRWGREVTIPAGAMDAIDRAVPMRARGCRAELQMTEPLPLSRWRGLGVRIVGGSSVPDVPMTASLVRGGRRHFLVYANYQALLEYNCSNAYALSAGLLADRLATRR